MAKTTPSGKKRRTTAEAEESLATDPRLQPRAARGWSSAQVLGVLCVGLGVGGFGGYTARGSGKPVEAAPAPAETVEGPRIVASAVAPAPAAGADKFGRPPGDEHFGHDHPPAEGAPGAAPAPAPAPGPDGKDSFGRASGHEHFGHNHP